MSGITYYEDEIYKNSFQNNQCQNYKELMEKWLKNEGKEKWKYVYYKNNKKCENEIENPPYSDPDGEQLKNCSYYCQLTQFLNKQEEWLQKKIGNPKGCKAYTYVAPSNAKCAKCNCESLKCDSDCKNKGCKNKITVDENSKKEKFYLKSDQFGFRVKGSRADFNNHPYGYLCELVKKKTENWDDKKANKEKERVYGVIAECIYQTRTLGGGFLWPVNIHDQYNKLRGGSATMRGGSYIEDRVDLTLLEIKHLFEWMEKWKIIDNCKDGVLSKKAMDEIEETYNELFKQQGKYKGDKLSEKVESVIEESNPIPAYIEWLRHFGSFENYVKFFCFDDFVDKKSQWMPIDILESELLPKFDWDDIDKNLWDKTDEKLKGTKKILTQPTKYKNHSENSIYCATSEKLEQMLKNVASLTLARSYRMQEVIDGI